MSDLRKIMEDMEANPPKAYAKYNPASNTWDAGWRWADGYFLPDTSGYRTKAQAEAAIPRLNERFKEIMESRKNLVPSVAPDLIAKARVSKQTRFESSNQLPDNEGRVFITHVPDAPLQCLGRLSLDGRWYVGRYTLASYDEYSRVNDVLPGVIVLRDEPVADAMIRHCIDQVFAAAVAGHAPPGFADFKRRLATSRFRRGQ